MKTITITSAINNQSVNIRVTPIELDAQSAAMLGATHYAEITPAQYSRILREVGRAVNVNPTNIDWTGRIGSAEVYFSL